MFHVSREKGAHTHPSSSKETNALLRKSVKAHCLAQESLSGHVHSITKNEGASHA